MSDPPCTLPGGEKFSYDPREQLLDDSTLYGRYELRRDLDAPGRARVEKVLEKFGQDETRLPIRAQGNCQTWLADAIATLEVERIVDGGEGQFWNERVGEKAEEMRRACEDRRKSWSQGTLQKITVSGNKPSGVDARYGQSEDRQVGRLEVSERFREAMEGLNAAFKGRS